MPFCCGGISADREEEEVTRATARGAVPVKPKLTYFGLAARAEVARLAFHAGKIDFEDVRVTMEEWPAMKAQMPNKQLPVLEVEGRQYTESLAIFEYAAERAGLLPTNPEERLKVDMIAESILTFYEMISKIFHTPEAEREAVLANVKETLLPQFLITLEAKCQGNAAEGFVVGKHLSAADIIVYGINRICEVDPFGLRIDPAFLQKDCPTLGKIIDNVAKNEGIAAYVQK